MKKANKKPSDPLKPIESVIILRANPVNIPIIALIQKTLSIAFIQIYADQAGDIFRNSLV